ncbi:MAG: gamma-glutamyl-phosphate reductase, partial [Candidatus Nitrotoga sp.]
MIATHITVDIENYINGLGQNARLAAKALANASTAQKNQALMIAAQALRAGKNALLADNAKDANDVRTSGKPAAFIDRLQLTDERVEAMAAALET